VNDEPLPTATASLRAHWRSGAVAGLLLLLAFALKRAYSSAGADALGWVLVPSCWLAVHAGGLSLAYEPGAGFISHASHMVVGPACAGVNFLVVAWLALYFGAQAHFASMRRKLVWLCACGAGAYLATIATNGLRIILAAHLFSADIYGGLLTKPRVHLLLGVVLYCSTLLLACEVIERRLTRTRATRNRVAALRTRSAPLLWYLGVVLLVPLARRAWIYDPRRFAEHAALTLGVTCAVAGCGWLFGMLLDRLQSRES
jgi:exosortase K